MKRFAIAAALAAVLALGIADTARAQFVQRYTTITPNGGVASSTQLYGPGAYKTYNTYVSPYGTVRQRSYYNDVLGNTYGFSNGYNVYNGLGYNRGYYLPSPFVSPSGLYPSGFSYNFYGRRW
jgi:hypothetical protein